MAKKSGSISVSTENIFPIIRKWLYSDQDIFVRELISNGTDAIHKLERLDAMGEAEVPAGTAYRIDLILDTEAKTLTFVDNGVGMTAEELDKYINDIAYSGAVDFVNRYQEQGDGSDGIIGHFGLGFYSAFMVADKVTIETLSWQPGAEPAHWESDNGMDYVMDAGSRTERGTAITIQLNAEAAEHLDGARLREIVQKYCAFMPREIYLTDVVADREAAAQREKRHREQVEAYKKRKAEAEGKQEAFTETEPAAPTDPVPYPVNDTAPLWLKNPSQCTDDAYKAFYRKACGAFRDPLFWIHLNMDYPFSLKGILYFPEMENRYQTLEGRIKLYSNQVFVADNMKEVIPDFLFLLKGFIDCPDIPLNVSRSYLQNDSYVRKLSDHIVRKVADKLNQLFEQDRPAYARYWKDIHVFIKYGVMRDDKFYDRVKGSLLFETVQGEDRTLAELGEKIYYTVDASQQVNYIRRAEKAGHTVVVMNDELDIPFISFLEGRQHPLKFVRIDTDLAGGDGESAWLDELTGLFQTAAGEVKLKVEVKAAGSDELAATLVETEESRRNLEMRKTFERMQGTGGDMNWDELFPVDRILQVNTDAELVSRLRAMAAVPDRRAEAAELAREIYDLSRLSHGSLQGDDLNAFLTRSTALLSRLTR